MPARDKEGMIRYLDIGNLPFEISTQEFHHNKIKERAINENREIDFQMTIDDIFAMSQGKLINKKYGGMVLSHTSFFATSIHIDATSTQLSQTSNIHGFFGLLLSVHRCWCH